MDDVAVRLEHVHLLDGLDGLHVKLLQRLLQLLVVAAGPGRCPLDLSPGGSLSTVQQFVSGRDNQVRFQRLKRASVRPPLLHTLHSEGSVSKPAQHGRARSPHNIPMRAVAPSFFNLSWTSSMMAGYAAVERGEGYGEVEANVLREPQS